MSDWNDELDEMRVVAMNELLQAGATYEQVMEAARTATESTVATAAARIADGLRSMLDEIESDAAQDREAEAAWTLEHWQGALAFYSAVVRLVEEAYGDFHDRLRDRYTYHASVIAGLMARATRVAHEVDVLLRHGFGSGALARARTLHEIAVVTAVIGEDETGELALRYHNHNAVTAWKRAGEFQRHAKELGREPIPGDEIRKLREDYRLVIEEYGPEFTQDWGWAIPAVGKQAVSLGDLIDKAGIEQLEPWRLWAHNEVHATSHGDVLNTQTYDGVAARITGPSRYGLADPAQLALIALSQTLTHALTASDIEEGARMGDVIVAQALSRLVDDANEALANAERSLYDDEGRSHADASGG